MKFKSLAAALALVASAAPAMAACTETFNLGVMGPPAVRVFGNDFGSAQHFEDCYNFTLAGTANSFGAGGEFDLTNLLGINLTSVSLTGAGGTLGTSAFNPSASTFSFSFSNLLAGTYQFVIAGDVTGRSGGFLDVGYGGIFTTLPSSGGIAAPVPEPQTYALLALGLLAVGWTVRRRNEA